MTVKSKHLVAYQNSFLVYHFKSLKLVQNSARMYETFIIIAGHWTLVQIRNDLRLRLKLTTDEW